MKTKGKTKEQETIAKLQREKRNLQLKLQRRDAKIDLLQSEKAELLASAEEDKKKENTTSRYSEAWGQICEILRGIDSRSS